MIRYLKAEHLKCKNTFLKKLVIGTPLFMILLAYFGGGMYYSQNGYNWWYVMIFPCFITLLAVLMNQYEQKKMHYRGVFSLPVSLKRTWRAKILLLCIYATIAAMIHFLGIWIGSVTTRTNLSLPVNKMFLASVILCLVSYWEIPLSLFLAKKIGFFGTLFINIGLGTILEIVFVNKSFWWVCPYSYAVRLMCPVIHILPSGLVAQKGDVMLNPTVLPVGIISGVVLFLILTEVTAHWFLKQEVK